MLNIIIILWVRVRKDLVGDQAHTLHNSSWRLADICIVDDPRSYPDSVPQRKKDSAICGSKSQPQKLPFPRRHLACQKPRNGPRASLSQHWSIYFFKRLQYGRPCSVLLKELRDSKHMASGIPFFLLLQVSLSVRILLAFWFRCYGNTGFDHPEPRMERVSNWASPPDTTPIPPRRQSEGTSNCCDTRPWAKATSGGPAQKGTPFGP